MIKSVKFSFTFAAIPFGDTLHLFGRDINLQVASVNVGILYIFSAASLGVYGVIRFSMQVATLLSVLRCGIVSRPFHGVGPPITN